MTPKEKGRLSLTVDGYESLAKAAWALWGALLVWRMVLWLSGGGSVGDVTLFALFVLLPIAVSGFAQGATSAYRQDLKANIVAGVSAIVDERGDQYIVVKGEHFSIPKKLVARLEVGDMVAVEFAPATRLVLQIHRISGPVGEDRQIEEGEEGDVGEAAPVLTD
jgi:hypothetical protein